MRGSAAIWLGLCACACVGRTEGAGEDASASSEGSATGESSGDGDEPGCGGAAEPPVGPPFDPAVCGSWSDPAPGEPSPAAPLACGEGGPCPTFRDVTLAAGLSYAQHVPTSPDAQNCVFHLPSGDGFLPHGECEPEWSSGGAAVGDFDADGWPDLFVTRLGARDLLWRNRGDGTFEEVGAEHGLGDCTFSNGAAFADVDDDGDLDLAVTALGQASHLLYVNEGGCFSDEAKERGFSLTVDGMHAGQSVAFGDPDLDGDLDAHVTEWIEDDYQDGSPAYGARFLRNEGGGFFADATQEAGVSVADVVPYKPGTWAYASAFVDLDEDGFPELVIAVDFGQARLLWNRGDGTFEDGTVAAGVDDIGNAMGLAFGDYDRDGRMDLFVSAIAEPSPEGCGVDECNWRGDGNRLYRNLGGRSFVDVTDAVGVRDGGWAWGTGFFDADNDGDLDLALTNGWPGRGLYGTYSHVSTPMRLWLSDGASMSEVGAERGVTDTGQGRGLLTFDYDRDGDLDLFVANHAGRPVLYRNEGGDLGHWLAVEVEGTQSNRDGRGAVVELQAREGGPVQIRHIAAGEHFLAGPELSAHFGLGAETNVHELRVRWPASGQEQVLHDVAAGQRLRLVEP